MNINKLAGNHLKVTLSTSQGEVFRGKTLATSLTIDQDSIETTNFISPTKTYIPGQITWNMELTGLGLPEWSYGPDFAHSYLSTVTPKEWECEFCHRANPNKHFQCGSCGWYRGLLTEIIQQAGIYRFK